MEILPKFGRNKLITRIISLVVIQSFILSSISFAAITKDKSKAPKITPIAATADNVTVEKDFGIIKSRFAGNSNKLVINIQDAHCNYEAQTNIVNILEGLINHYDLKLVSVEGADGIIDTTWFKAFPDEEVRKEVATYFMKKGEITGPEFLSITKDYPISLFGAEDRKSYLENLNAFTSSYPLKAEVEKYYNSIKSALSRLKTLIYNDGLKAMDAKSQDYESKKIQFNEYIRFLQAEAEKEKINLRGYENFFRLVSVLIYEKKIDFNVTDKERSALIDELSRSISKDALTELVAKSIDFKAGKISSVEFYNHLKKLSNECDIDLSKKYVNLYNYIVYNSVYAKIDNEKLFNDIKLVENAIKEKLFQNDDQRTLDKLSRHIDILLGMVNIKLLNGDFNYYQTHREEFSHEAFTSFIQKKATQYGLAYEVEPPTEAVAKSIPKLEDFYSIAMKRDKALVDNTLKEMSKEKQNVAVLVTGGFHSEGMSKLLEKEGVSYIVICPSITKDVPTPYIQILTNQRTPLEDILTSPEAKKSMLAPFSRVLYAPLDEEHLRELLYTATTHPRARDKIDAGLKATIEDLIGEAQDVRHQMITRFIQQWLIDKLPFVAKHPYARDEAIMKEAYLKAMRASLTDSEMDIKTAGKVVKVISSLPEFDRIFTTVFNRVMPAAGVASYIRRSAVVVPGETLVSGNAAKSGVLTAAGIFTENGQLNNSSFSSNNSNDYRIIRLKDGRYFILEVASGIAGYTDPVTGKMTQVSGGGTGASQNITLAQAYSTPELFDSYIIQAVSGAAKIIPELPKLIADYNSWKKAEVAPLEKQLAALQQENTEDSRVKAKALKKQIDDMIKKRVAVIDDLLSEKYNSPMAEQFVGSLAGITSDSLVSDIPTLEEFRKSPDYPKYMAMAREMTLGSSIGELDVYAGAASRLFGEGQAADTSLSFAGHDIYQIAELQGTTLPDNAIKGLSVMTRIALQKWLDVEEELKRKYEGTGKTEEEIRKEREKIIAQKPWIIVVNDESGLPLLQEMVAHNHYGFDPEKVVFAVQPTFHGYSYDENGRAVRIDSTRPTPAGHGSATMQALNEGRAFWVDKNGRIHDINEDAETYLYKKSGVRLWVQGRVNDILKLGYIKSQNPELALHEVDMGILALTLSQMEDVDTLSHGKNAVLEQVGSDPRIKGAAPIQAGGRQFLVEKVAMSAQVRKVAIGEGKPQNRFFNFYKRLALREVKRQGLPVYLRFRDGYLYAETVTGDITMLKDMNAGWAMETTRQLTDYKDLATLENGVGGALKQDSDPVFRKYAIAEAKRSRDSVNITGLELAAGLNNNTPAGAVKNDGFMTGQMMEHEQVYVEGQAVSAGDSKFAVVSSMQNLMGITHEQASSLHERLSRELYPNSQEPLTGGSIILVNGRLIWIAAYGDSDDRKTAILDLSAGAVLDRNVYTDHVSLGASSLRFEAAGPILTIKTSGVVLTTVNIDDLASRLGAVSRVNPDQVVDALIDDYRGRGFSPEQIARLNTIVRPAAKNIEEYLYNQYRQGNIRGKVYSDGMKNIIPNLSSWCTDSNMKPATQRGIEKAVSDGRWADIAYAYLENMAFGTAGLRGKFALGGDFTLIAANAKNGIGLAAEILKGPNTFNDEKVRTFTLGLLKWRAAAKDKKPSDIKLGIAYDSRIAGAEFAELIKNIAIAYGVKVYISDEAMPLPEFSCAMKELGLDIGLFISASHNSKFYNGLKIIGPDGSQMGADDNVRKAVIKEIAGTTMAEAVSLRAPREIPSGQLTYMGGHDRLSGVEYAGHELLDTHAIHQQNVFAHIGNRQAMSANASKINILQCPFYGAGRKAMANMLRSVGFKVESIEDMYELDGTFPALDSLEPSLRVPDPALPAVWGVALDLYAKRHGRDALLNQNLIFGSDPDADRFGLLVRIPAREISDNPKVAEAMGVAFILTPEEQARYNFGGFRVVSPNEWGAMIDWYDLNILKSQNKIDHSNDVIVYSHVTSDVYSKIADLFGVQKAVLPVGVDQIAAFIAKEESKGRNIIGGHEESGTYATGRHVRDKDGFLAGMRIAEIAAFASSQGKTVADLLNEMALNPRIGFFATTNTPIEFETNVAGLDKKNGTVEWLQKTLMPQIITGLKVGAPVVIAGDTVVDADEQKEYRSGKYDDRTYAGFPDAGLRFYLNKEKTSYITIRPSGTEPKIRFYVQIGVTEKEGTTPEELAEVKKAAYKHAIEITNAWLDIVNNRALPSSDKNTAPVSPKVSETRPIASNTPVMATDDTISKVRVVEASAPLTTDTIGQVPSWVPGNFPLSAYIEASRATLSETVRSVATHQGVGVNSDVAAIIAIDTDIGDRGARDIAQAVENRLRDMQIGDDAVVIVRASGADLIDAINKERTRLTALGKRVAVVINTNTSVNSAVEEQLSVIVRETSTGLTDQNGQPVGQSALLKMDNRDKRAFSVLGLIDVDMRIAFNQGDENILRGLNSIAVNARTGQHFTSSDLAGILCGQLHLKPMTPVDVNNIDDLQRGEKAAAHSL